MTSGVAMEGRPLASFLVVGEDCDSFVRHCIASGGVSPAHTVAGRFRVTFHDTISLPIQADIFHAPFEDFMDTRPCHLLGICEVSERTAEADGREGPDIVLPLPRRSASRSG